MNIEAPDYTEYVLPLTLMLPHLIVELSEAQNHRCCYCQLPMFASDDLQDKNWNNMRTLEHVVPKSKGGCDCSINLVSACRMCNTLRGSVEGHVFTKIIQQLMTLPEIKAQWHNPDFLETALYLRIQEAVKKRRFVRIPTLNV